MIAVMMKCYQEGDIKGLLGTDKESVRREGSKLQSDRDHNSSTPNICGLGYFHHPV